MNRLTISKRQITALLKVAAKNDVRYYLNGVYIDFDKKILVTTDGHMMMIFRPADITGEGNFIVPRDLLETAAKLVGNGLVSYDPTVEIICESEGNRIVINAASSAINGNAIDGKYPDFTRVIPDKFSGVPTQIQTHLYSVAGDALKACAGQSVAKSDYPLIAHNGAKGNSKSHGAAVMYLHNYADAFVVIMPFRPNLESNAEIADAAKTTISNLTGVKS